MAQRIELGFASTQCKCSVCTNNCKHISGMIIPEDLVRWQDEHGDGFLEWALEHLAASPGALVMIKGQVMRIPTLVPLRLPDGRCHWLNNQDLCDIHATAPFGCSHFDHAMNKVQADQRSTRALYSIMQDIDRNGLYIRIWGELNAMGQTVEAPEKVRTYMPTASKEKGNW